MTRLLISAASSLLVFLSCMAGNASGATVQFSGSATFNGGAPIIGVSTADPVGLYLVLSYPDTLGAPAGTTVANAVAGTLSLGGRTFNLTSASMFLNDGGGPVIDTINFFTNSFQGGGDIATFGLAYTNANLVSDSSITTPNLTAMTFNRTTNFTISFSGAGSFAATVTGVPEPATTASLFALVAGFATCRVIRRRKAGK